MLLGSLRLTCCIAYIDDVCIYSNGSLADHMSKVQAVLKALRLVGFTGNPTKCIFAQKSIQFLGFVVSENGVYAQEDKVRCMLNYKRPTSLQELRSFLGLMSYYRKFIKNFSLLAAPLTELTSQPRNGRTSRDLKRESKEEWDGSTWTDAHETAFQALKGALLSRPVLALPLKQENGG